MFTQHRFVHVRARLSQLCQPPKASMTLAPPEPSTDPNKATDRQLLHLARRARAHALSVVASKKFASKRRGASAAGVRAR
eukprot:2194087-Prymnesium_polylepis.1